jgi:hypothetical protein
MTPTEGAVGTTVTLVGNITTTNGNSSILWDGKVLVPHVTAVGNSVNVSFTVPPSTAGNHAVMLLDVASKQNSTQSFNVTTAYSLSVLPTLVAPAQSQEGDNFTFSLGITGGNNGVVNVANFTVVAPNNASYTNLSNVTVGNDGNGTLTLNYPGDFAAANTSLVGQYGVFFNSTLETGAFYVGLTNSSAYHRNQAVDVKALYAPDENVTLSLTGPNLNCSENLTADSTGIVHYVNSTILSVAPANASSTYTVNVTSITGPTVKSPPDVQNFTVPGLAVNITARNLAGEPVPDVGVNVFENQTLVSSSTTDSDGLVTTLLETGNYFSNVSYGGQEIGTFSPMIVNETSTVFDIYCNLTNLRITVKDEDGVLIPGVGLYLAEENQTSAAMTINATDVNGTAIGHSILPILNNAPINFVLNASLDGIVFNTTEPLELPVEAWFNISIVVPKMSLQVNVTNADLQPIQNATVNAMNNNGGLFYSGNTAANGTVTLNCTLGTYLVQVYSGGIELNEATVNLNSTTVNTLITCPLYGLSVSVRVSDYFGQPIPKLTVTLQRAGYLKSMISGSNGLATFSNVVGGNLEVAVYSGGQSNQLALDSLYVSNSTTIRITLGNYVVLAGMLVGTGQFATVMILVVSVVFILGLEVYRRRWLRPKKAES